MAIRASKVLEDGTSMDYLIFGLFLVGWILLQHVLLSKLGVPT